MQEMLPPNRYKQGSKFRPLFYTDLGLAFNASLSVVERFVDEFYGRNGLGHTLIFVEVSMLALRVNKKSGFHRFNQGYLCFFLGVCVVFFLNPRKGWLSDAIPVSLKGIGGPGAPHILHFTRRIGSGAIGASFRCQETRFNFLGWCFASVAVLR